MNQNKITLFIDFHLLEDVSEEQDCESLYNKFNKYDLCFIAYDGQIRHKNPFWGKQAKMVFDLYSSKLDLWSPGIYCFKDGCISIGDTSSKITGHLNDGWGTPCITIQKFPKFKLGLSTIDDLLSDRTIAKIEQLSERILDYHPFSSEFISKIGQELNLRLTNLSLTPKTIKDECEKIEIQKALKFLEEYSK